jgi:hypothetical protein
VRQREIFYSYSLYKGRDYHNPQVSQPLLALSLSGVSLLVGMYHVARLFIVWFIFGEPPNL